MLINLRNALMAGKRLPYDAEVEFLESTGTQYINTGIMGASEWHITAQGAATPTTSNCVIATTSSGGSFWGNYGAVNYWAVGNGSSWRCSVPYTSIGSFIVSFSASSVQFTVNGETVTRTSAPDFSKAFCLYSTNGEGYGAKVRVYGCKVYQSGVLVRDFIPVRKGTVGYLYDRVSGKLFGNAGTGDFVLGPDVVPVEYIESHGTEYIDTGVIGTDAGTLTMRLKKTDANGTRRFILNTAVNPQPVGSSVYFDVNASGYFGQASNGYECIVGRWYDIEIVRGVGYYFDGTLRIPTTLVFPFRSANNLLLFWVSTNNKFIGQISALKIYDNNDTSVRSFRPIRVGTDATSWEGAMMDVLTRRIYRNAGTGAFTYGNDLKYPIPAS